MYSLRSAVLAVALSAGLCQLAEAAELVMVEQPGCHWCERWDAEIAPTYPKTDEGALAPLRRVDLHDLPEDIRFRSPPVFTPTFVLVQDGQELARLEGYAGDEFFWYLLSQILDENADMIAPDPTAAGVDAKETQ